MDSLNVIPSGAGPFKLKWTPNYFLKYVVKTESGKKIPPERVLYTYW
jgi:hypothetical protein